LNCTACGNDLRAGARFCDSCGSAVGPNRTAGELKQVTVLFADVVGSMKLAAALDPERLQEIMHELFNRAAAVVQRYHGTVDKFTGDGLMALFGAPIALEDHAVRACIAALEIQSLAQDIAAKVLRRDNITLRVRVGLNSGEMLFGEIGTGPNSFTAVGHPVGMAQRMESVAPPGGVLCSESTARLVEHATSLDPTELVYVKGEPDPLPARLLRAVESDQVVVGRDEGPMLGRDADLKALREAFQAGRGSPVGVVGAPGLGKSRLIQEFCGWAADHRTDVVIARCEAHTADVPFRALSRVLRATFGIGQLTGATARKHVTDQFADLLAPESDDAQILFDLLGIADPHGGQPEVSLDSRRRRLVEVMTQTTRARASRILFVLEDAHWIDTTSDETLAEFAAALRTTQAMFITSYRSEYHGALHRLADRTITLEPLTDAAVITLITTLIGQHPTLVGLAQRIAQPAAGNPFFVEEIVRDLAEARAVIAELEGRRLPAHIPAYDLWLLGCRAMLVRVEGDAGGYTDNARRYLELAERLDARGRLPEARRMVAEIT
jgi:adenylate cyclase